MYANQQLHAAFIGHEMTEILLIYKIKINYKT